MPNQITNTEQAAYIAETTWGTTPATPTAKIIRLTGITSQQDKTTVQSKEITASREIADIIQTGANGGLTIPFEFSYDTQFEDFLTGLLGGAWVANVLKVGTTRTSFAIQRGFPDISQFALFNGCVPTQFNFATTINNVIAGSITFVSKFPVFAGTTAWTGVTAAGTNSVFDPIASIQLVQEGGAGSIAGVTEFSCSIANGVANMDVLAALSPLDIQLGTLVASGTFTAYFPDLTYWTKFSAHTTTSLILTLGGTSTKKYSFSFAKVKLSKVDLANSGMNGAIMQKYTWEAFKDATDSTVKVTRTP